MHTAKNTVWARFTSAWQLEWKNTLFRYQFLVFTPLLVVSVALYTNFLHSNEGRQGSVLNDPLFAMFSPIDLTWVIFFSIYGLCLCGFYELLWKPQRLLFGFQVYILVAIFRVICIYLVPLEPSPKMILMEEPIVQFLVNSPEAVQKDLFFSGHTSTLFLFFLLAHHRILKVMLLLGSVFVGVCLILQQVHYTIDILAAPVASYLAYRIVILTQQKIAYPLRQALH